MRLLVSKHNLGVWAANYVAKKINDFKPTKDKPFVLGLPTGSTPLDMYNELIRLNKEDKVSFKHVVTFNMDEYVGLAEDHPESYHYYMHHNFFRHIDINKKNIHILDGNAKDLDAECEKYEEKIAKVGGIHIQLGGVGEDGHLAFNEPGSSLASKTRSKDLNLSTIIANSRFFGGDIEKTPKLALTIGIDTVMQAKEVIVMAKGFNKALAVCQAIEGAVSSMCPITALQYHKKALIICDEHAAYELKLKTIKYFENMQDEYSEMEHACDYLV
ncbi:MAG: glucosamine-6-phosphate deaminase [Neisseriales bacterium]|jgi:glucosamine-6-phosphate deaminase|nr:MAG: glucosamine-6-phosphate deaminase [Neisseriales bacterium]